MCAARAEKTVCSRSRSLRIGSRGCAGRGALLRRRGSGQLGDETAAVREALRAFADLGTALIGARDTGPLGIDAAANWVGFAAAGRRIAVRRRCANM